MISIQSAMLVALGFLGASLLGLLVASAFWARAVRLTTQRIKQSMPVSEPEIKADRDRLRAEYAIKVHKLETQLEQARLERARQLIEINRRDASISTLETDVVQLKAGLEEHQNARRVLEQTVADRLPRVEARLAEAKRLLFNRDREIAELTANAKRHKQALEEASAINAQQSAQIERLTTALSARGRGRLAGAESPGETALRAEIEALRGKAREQAMLIDRLQRRLGQGYVLAAPVKAAAAAAAAADGEVEQAKRDIAEAEAAIESMRASGAGEGDPARAAFEREIRALKTHAEDQAGEIARLKAALATFERQDGRSGGLRNSKIALKARLGSVQAQADQQAATIAKLRAELAATHERLARQAAHFMSEMRRIGTGNVPVPSTQRRLGNGVPRPTLSERMARVTAPRTTTAARSGEAKRAEPGPQLANGLNGKPRAEADKVLEKVGEKAPEKTAEKSAEKGSDKAPEKAAEPALEGIAGKVPEKIAGTAEAAPANPAPIVPVSGEPAAEKPQPALIPGRRRPRLIDRIAGLAKSS